jgi:hypothetical protein
MLALSFFTILLSCKKIIKVAPAGDQIIRSTVFTDDSYATSALTGIYSELSANGASNGGSASISMLSGFSADEFDIHTTAGDYAQFYANALTPDNTNISGIWNLCYKIIYMANDIIEGLGNSTGMSETVKNQLTGEAKFLRAFAHLYLTSLFGDVPVVTTTDVDVTRNLSRSAQSDVYLQIESDLVAAKELLPESYSQFFGERVRANKYAAIALLARLYLYKKDWPRAEQESTRIIEKENQYELLNELNAVFLKNSKEAIWQLIPREKLSPDGFILTSVPGFASLSETLVNTFEASDQRKAKWAGTFVSPALDTFYYPFKYKVKIATVESKYVEYSMVLRLAEQYLIRAEARARQNKLTGINSAEADINKIRNRAGLLNTTASTEEGMLDEILLQRRLELFSEWGHRWIDLTRTGKATAILDPIKPQWKETSVLYPLPRYELINNHELTQNEGYPK